MEIVRSLGWGDVAVLCRGFGDFFRQFWGVCMCVDGRPAMATLQAHGVVIWAGICMKSWRKLENM